MLDLALSSRLVRSAANRFPLSRLEALHFHAERLGEAFAHFLGLRKSGTQRGIDGDGMSNRSGLLRREFAERVGRESGIFLVQFHVQFRVASGIHSRRRFNPVWIRKPMFPWVKPVTLWISS